MAPDAEDGRFAVPRIIASTVKSARQIVSDVQSGASSAEAEVTSSLEAIRSKNDELNVFLFVDEVVR